MQRLTFPFPFVHHQSHDWKVEQLLTVETRTLLRLERPRVLGEDFHGWLFSLPFLSWGSATLIKIEREKTWRILKERKKRTGMRFQELCPAADCLSLCERRPENSTERISLLHRHTESIFIPFRFRDPVGGEPILHLPLSLEPPVNHRANIYFLSFLWLGGHYWRWRD